MEFMLTKDWCREKNIKHNTILLLSLSSVYNICVWSQSKILNKIQIGVVTKQEKIDCSCHNHIISIVVWLIIWAKQPQTLGRHSGFFLLFSFPLKLGNIQILCKHVLGDFLTHSFSVYC